jgi:hypothetical protein
MHSIRFGLGGGRADNYNDFFVTKLTAGGKSMVYSTYFGGSAHDIVEGIAADPEGHAYIVCYTDSMNLPIKDAIQPFFAGKRDMYYAKILPDGSGLVYGSYFGGSDWDGVGAVAGVDLGPNGTFWIAGSCHSRGMATAGAFQTDFSSIYPVSILAKFNATDGSLMAATYFDSTYTDSIAVDAAGDVWIGGSASEGLTLVNPIQPNYGGSGPDTVHAADGYLAKFSSDCSTLLFSTYFGGATSGSITSLAVDPKGDVLFVGAADPSEGFPIVNAFQPEHSGGRDAFVGKISLAEVLKVSRSSQELVFTWPASATGYRLESTDTLGSEVNWQPLDITPVNNGTEWEVKLGIGSGSRFYRIAKP